MTPPTEVGGAAMQGGDDRNRLSPDRQQALDLVAKGIYDDALALVADHGMPLSAAVTMAVLSAAGEILDRVLRLWSGR